MEGRSGDRRTPAQVKEADRLYKIADFRAEQRRLKKGDPEAWSAATMRAQASPPAKVSRGGRRRR